MTNHSNHRDDPIADAPCDTSAEHAVKLDATQLTKLAWEYARSVGAAATDGPGPEPRQQFRANPFIVNEHGSEATDALSLSQILTASYAEHDMSLFHALAARVMGGDADDDAPVYMGNAGAAWLLFKIHRVDPEFSLGSQSALAIAYDLAERAHAAALVTIERSCDGDYVSLSPFPSGVGFLCTPVGAFAVTAVVRHQYKLSVELGGEDAHDDGDTPLDAEAVKDSLAELNTFIQRHAFSPDCPSEVLFGRAGLVAALQFVARYIPETRDADHAYSQALPVDNLLPSLVETIIEDSRNSAAALAQTNPNAPQLTLAWSTLGKWYLGAAHGAAGILTVLLSLPDDLIVPYLDEIKQTVFDLAQISEYPTTIDKLGVTDAASGMVQWCHGTVGLGLLFVRAFAKFGDDAFLVRAAECGELAWEQGIVDKHVGLCHGVAGNAYLFLSLWRATRQQVWYQRTLAFALIAAHWQGGHCDHPASVWEGWGGLASLLADLLVTPEPVVGHDIEEDAQRAQSPNLETEATDLLARTAHARVPLAEGTATAPASQGFPCVDDC